MNSDNGGDDVATVASSTVERNTSTVSIGNEPLPFVFVFSILLIPRLLAAQYSIIGDCDEVFNYWEPTHYLVHGTGFQTWEYSPTYAIRSWAYVAIHALIVKVFQLLGSSKVQSTKFQELKF
jgi:Alg9-like mannosyltransferase family